MTSRFKIILIVLLTIASVITGIVYIAKEKKERQIEQELIENEAQSDIKYATEQPELNVVSVSPSDNAINIPLFAKIEITFNQLDDTLDSEFSIHPQTAYDLAWKQNKLIVTPKENLKEGTIYTYIIKYQSRVIPSGPYSFTTAGPLAPLPDTQPEGAAEAELAFQRVNHPDVYLRGLTPNETDSFSATTEFVGGEGGHFQITVVQKNPEGKNNFLYWLKSVELTDEQIVNLDVIYQ